MKNAIYEGKYSLIITNYPCPAPVELGEPEHEFHILPGEQQHAYFLGTYEQCIEVLEAFNQCLRPSL